ncbi:Predicted arabinose efflux permease, MFS family [Chryseobacterium limigenitum]|uniref:Predicted arabinose efflux permease, MFS family n=2 Tax=Chryseobacterium limigenitum TaxID=1612149 RepID=A0A1K2ISW8_9FLAO|nr:Predicted arabinose efflux permease, MFS family [Chryseobacterium limigenitum]
MRNFREFNKWLSLIVISMSIFLCVLDLFIVNIAIPSIRNSLQANSAEAQFIIVFYIIGYGAFLITGSKIGNKFGHKKTFIASMFSFMVFSLLCGISSSAIELNISRLFQGISAAFMVPQGVALISSVFEIEEERVKALGIYGAIAGIASVVGQVLGGIIPDLNFSFDAWRLVFFINIPLALLVIILAKKYLKEVEVKNKESIQMLPQIILIILLIILMYEIVAGGEEGWSGSNILLMLLSVIGFIVFIFHQKSKFKQGKEVLINIQPFFYPSFKIALLAAVTYYLVQDSYFFVNANFLEEQHHLSSTKTGLLFACQGVGYVIASLLSVRFLNKYQEKFIIFGLVIMVAGLIGHIYTIGSSTVNLQATIVVLFFYGIGCGIVLPSMFTNAMRKLPVSITSIATGVYLTIQQISVGFGVSLVGRIYFNFTNGYLMAVYAMIFLLLITISIFLISEFKLKRNSF